MPEITGRELFECHHIRGGVHRRDRHSSSQPTFEQLVLGLGPCKFNDAFTQCQYGIDQIAAREHAGFIGGPVFCISPGLGDDATVDHPWNHFDDGCGGGDQHHIAIRTRINQRSHQRTQLQDSAIAFDVTTLDVVRGHRVQASPEHCSLYGDIDELRLATLETAMVGNQRRKCGFGCGMEPGLRNGDADRSAVRFSIQGNRTTHG